jgi:hypothetical protein
MYMAPEQAKGEALGPRADLFSLGSVLYAMCTGRPPFEGENTFAILKRVIEEEPRPVRELAPQVPEWLCRIVEKLHAKAPAERFQTAKEVAELLADCEAQWKAKAGLTDTSRIPVPRPARGGWWWVIASVLALLVGLGVYALTRQLPRPEPEPGKVDTPDTPKAPEKRPESKKKAPPPTKTLAELEKELDDARQRFKTVKARHDDKLASITELYDAQIEMAEAELAWATIKFEDKPDVDEVHNMVVGVHFLRATLWALLVKEGKATEAELAPVMRAFRAAEQRRNVARKKWGLPLVPPRPVETGEAPPKDGKKGKK